MVDTVILPSLRLACHADLSEPSMAAMLVRLWNLAQQQGVGQTKLVMLLLHILSAHTWLPSNFFLLLEPLPIISGGTQES